jgi:hypothetical protein
MTRLLLPYNRTILKLCENSAGLINSFIAHSRDFDELSRFGGIGWLPALPYIEIDLLQHDNGFAGHGQHPGLLID